jgi:anti-anti-sigma regulatory factor
MGTMTGGLDFTRDGDTLVVILVGEVHESDYACFEEEAMAAMSCLDDASITSVVLDCCTTDYFGTSALKFLARLRDKVQAKNACMAVCRASAHELEVLRGTHLDGSWPICPSRAEALQAVRR